MNPFKLTAALIARRPASWAFHVLVLAMAAAVTGAVLLVQQAAEEGLQRDLAEVDLVVGAEGSPLQLVMSALFQTDAPTGNIPLEDARRLAADPLVARAIPLSLGDSLGTARIVGTEPAYADLYGARLRDGRWWTAPLEAVIGAEVARTQGLAPGDEFVGAHGLGTGGHAHEDHPYRVVGVLAPTGAVIDRLILTDLASVWVLHEPHAAEAAPEHHAHVGHDHDHETSPRTEAAAREVTAVLIQYRSALGAVTLPPRIDRIPGLQAASPAREAQRLNALLGAGAGAMTRLGQGLMLVAALGFVVATSAAVMARRRELALLTALGCGPIRLASLILLEAAILGLAAGLAGWLGARGLTEAVARWGASPLDLPTPPLAGLDVLLIAGPVLVALLAGLPAAVIAARTDPVRVLGER